MSDFEDRVTIFREGMADRRAVLRGLPKDSARREAALRMVEAGEAHAAEVDGVWVISCWPGEGDRTFPHASRLRQRMMARRYT